MVKLVNRAKRSTSTTGTGTIALSSAETGDQSFDDAGVSDGDVVVYVVEDGDNWELGRGIYTSSNTSLTRSPTESSNSGSTINLSGEAKVFVSSTANEAYQYTSATITVDQALASNVEYETGNNTTIDAGATLTIPSDSQLVINTFAEKRPL